MACRVLNVFPAGYYDWLGRPASPRQQENEYLVKLIEKVHHDSRGTYGSPRVHGELVLGLGLPVNLKRVARRQAITAQDWLDAHHAAPARSRQA